MGLLTMHEKSNHGQSRNRTDDVTGCFSRASDAARRADSGEAFEGKITRSFEYPQRMFAIRSEARRRLMLEGMHEPRTIIAL